jgi:hypothetical protein
MLFAGMGFLSVRVRKNNMTSQADRAAIYT